MSNAIAQLKTSISEILDTPIQTIELGKITSISGNGLTVSGLELSIGDFCLLESADGRGALATVISLNSNAANLLPLESLESMSIAARVHRVDTPFHDIASRASSFLGQAFDSFGRSLGQLQATKVRTPISSFSKSSNGSFQRGDSRESATVMDRISPNQQLSTGLAALDLLLPIGIGQRFGVFAAAGVGKTTFLHDLMLRSQFDVKVICLVGERGREVQSLWNSTLDEQSRSNSILVAETSDRPAVVRAYSVESAIRIAEELRDSGKHVGFFVDSLTRYAYALRDIGIAANEPPLMRGYVPSVFAKLATLIERCGVRRNSGSITGIFSVLTDDDTAEDPLTEALIALLDGHILLSRELANLGQFPAIDLIRSVSRVAANIVPESQLKLIRAVRSDLTRIKAARTLIDAGFYQRGANPELDLALKRQAPIRQAMVSMETEPSAIKTQLTQLMNLYSLQ
jgi:flagellum-specific ATP synthase